MKGQRRALVSLLAAVALLTLMCSVLFKQDASRPSSELQVFAKQPKIFCSGPVSAAAFLVAVKARIFGAGGVGPASSIVAMLRGSNFYSQRKNDFLSANISGAERTRPLWLVNRSLLI